MNHHLYSEYLARLLKYDIILSTNGSNYHAYVSRGNVKCLTNDINGGICDYNRAIAIEPTYAKAYLNRGVAKFSNQNLSGAILDYETAIRINPLYHLAYYNLGIAKNELGRYLEALNSFTRAIEIHPKKADYYLDRSLSYVAIGDKASVNLDLNSAIQIDRHCTSTQHYQCRYDLLMKKLGNFS